MKAKMIYMVAALALVFSLASVIMPANPAQAATITVTNTSDSGVGSLRWAIANATVGDEINFTVTGTITLTSGQLTINKSLTITGPGEANLAISGGNTYRVFYINNTTVDMFGITIRNGNTTDNGGGIYNNGGNVTLTSCTVSGNYADDNGGGIYNNDDNMTLTNCTISGNEAYTGGGIYNEDGNVTMTNCTISGNNSKNDGGGIYNEEEMTMTDCTISNNSSSDEPGGGICNLGTLNMNNCTVSDNDADDWGGGICNSSGNVTLTNCTVSGNNANEDGGGIWTTGIVTLTNCTITDNEAGDNGGGIHCLYGDVTMTCTIVYGNTAGGSGHDVYEGIVAIECIIGDPDGDSDPLLGPLQNNGGSTKTHALLAGSPAIDGCNTSCSVNSDQRGLPRPIDGNKDGIAYCDVGAYEKQLPAPVGGTIEPVDKISILAPWIGLAALIAVAMAVFIIMKRRHVA